MLPWPFSIYIYKEIEEGIRTNLNYLLESNPDKVSTNKNL